MATFFLLFLPFSLSLPPLSNYPSNLSLSLFIKLAQSLFLYTSHFALSHVSLLLCFFLRKWLKQLSSSLSSPPNFLFSLSLPKSLPDVANNNTNFNFYERYITKPFYLKGLTDFSLAWIAYSLGLAWLMCKVGREMLFGYDGRPTIQWIGQQYGELAKLEPYWLGRLMRMTASSKVLYTDEGAWMCRAARP